MLKLTNAGGTKKTWRHWATSRGQQSCKGSGHKFDGEQLREPSQTEEEELRGDLITA